MKQILARSITFLVLLALPSVVRADDEVAPPRINGMFGVSYGVGKMQNNDLNLVSRTMAGASLNGFGGYSFGRWMIGLDFDYTWTSQLSELSNTGNTNLKGRGWIFGVGAKYELSSYVAFQGTFGFLGNYTFFQQTASGQSASMTCPLSFRLKTQFFTVANSPLSLDVDLRYISWVNYYVEQAQASQTTSQWSAGLGVTYHLGRLKKKTQSPSEVTVTETETHSRITENHVTSSGRVLHQQEMSQEEVSLAEITQVTRGEDEFILTLEDPHSIKKMGLTKDGRVEAGRIGSELAKHPHQLIRLEGHNVSGKTLKQIRSTLIAKGVDEDHISTRANQDSTPKRKHQHRKLSHRVDVHIDTTYREPL